MSVEELTTVLPSGPEQPGSLSNSVLIAEDDAMFRKILENWLEHWGYRVVVAEDGAKAWNILQQEGPPQLLILDWIMPGINGMELCRRIREQRNSPYQYILLVTSKDDKQDVVHGLEAGADDYLTKPFDRDELRARLRTGSRILTLQKDLIHARENLRFQATHDALTGIWNRGAIVAMLRRELDRAFRSQGSVAVLMLDLDHFKRINDTHGHLAGDDVLKEAANRVVRSTRSYDLVGRYGGEEFLIVLPGCDSDQLRQAAERIRRTIGDTPMQTLNSSPEVTASIGATVCADNNSAEEVLAVADAALYQAKNSGRDRVAIL